MLAALSAPLLMLAQAPAAAAAPQAATQRCPRPDPNSSTIVICAERPQGYRLDPDVMTAKRQARRQSRPRPNHPAPRQDCATVGPAPCATAGINLLAAGLTAVQMAKRLAEGKEVGSMFVTDPHPSEYELYLAAKAQREAEEAERAAKAVKKKAEAAKAD